MFIKYVLGQQILITADQYTQNPLKSVRDYIFKKYLFKIIRIPDIKNNKSAEAICIKIQTIQIEDNIILRKTAQMKVKVLVAVIVLRLMPQEYFQGQVVKTDAKGITVKFIGGLLQGIISIKNMHKDTIYNEQKSQWILTTGDQNNKGYQWNIGAKVRFRVIQTFWEQPYEGPQEEAPSMADLIRLRADEAGLGPIQWWL